MPSQRFRSGGHRDSGAVAVETAAVSMFLIVLLMGIVESSFLFKDWVTVSAAARAGARMGAGQPKVSTFAQSAADQVANSIQTSNSTSGLIPANIQAVWVYKATAATGLPDSGNFTTCTACVKYTWNGTSLVQSSSGWNSGLSTGSPPGQNACIGDPARMSLGVYVQYKHSSPLHFFFDNFVMSESTVMWLEPFIPASGCKS
jgi:Flp pilus assembly protein TadG